MDQVIYQTTSGATTRPNMDQYQSLVNTHGQEEVDKMFANLGWHRAGSGQSSALFDYAKDLNLPVNDLTKDYLLESFLNEKASENAWNRSVFSSKNQYQWMVQDLQKAGLNPWLAISGLNAASAQSTGQGVSGGNLISRANNRATNTANLIKATLTAIASIIGIALFKK